MSKLGISVRLLTQALVAVAMAAVFSSSASAVETFYNRSNTGDLAGWPSRSDFINDTNRIGNGTGATFGGSLGTAVDGNGVFYNLQGNGAMGRYSSFATVEANSATSVSAAGTHTTNVVDIATNGSAFYRLDNTATAGNVYSLVSFSTEADFLGNTNSSAQTTAAITGGLRGLALGEDGTVFGLNTAGNLIVYSSIADLLIDNRVQTYNTPGFGGSRGIAVSTTVPEPATAMLGAFSVAGLVLRRRRA